MVWPWNRSKTRQAFVSTFQAMAQELEEFDKELGKLDKRQEGMTEDCEDEVARTKALQEMITATIAALGEEKAKPFEFDAYFECVEMDINTQDQLCPRVRLVKR